MNNFTVKKKTHLFIIGLSLGIFCIIFFTLLFWYMLITYLIKPDTIFLVMSVVSFLLKLYGAYCIYSAFRPKIIVNNETITYYPQFKRKREINIAEITQKSRKVDKFDIIAKNQNGILNIGFITAVQLNKNNFERFVNIISYYSGDEKILTFKSHMKNAKLLEEYIDSKRPQIEEIIK